MVNAFPEVSTSGVGKGSKGEGEVAGVAGGLAVLGTGTTGRAPAGGVAERAEANSFFVLSSSAVRAAMSFDLLVAASACCLANSASLSATSWLWLSSDSFASSVIDIPTIPKPMGMFQPMCWLSMSQRQRKRIRNAQTMATTRKRDPAKFLLPGASACRWSDSASSTNSVVRVGASSSGARISSAAGSASGSGSAGASTTGNLMSGTCSSVTHCSKPW